MKSFPFPRIFFVAASTHTSTFRESTLALCCSYSKRRCLPRRHRHPLLINHHIPQIHPHNISQPSLILTTFISKISLTKNSSCRSLCNPRRLHRHPRYQLTQHCLCILHIILVINNILLIFLNISRYPRITLLPLLKGRIPLALRRRNICTRKDPPI